MPTARSIRHRRGLAALVLLLWLEGCTAYGRTSPGTLQAGAQSIRLRAATPLRVRLAQSSEARELSGDVAADLRSAASGDCQVQALAGRLIRVRGDTLVLDRLTEYTVARGVNPAVCPSSRTAVEVVPMANTEVAVQRMSAGRTLALLVVLGAVTAVIVFATMWNSGGGGCSNSSPSTGCS